MNREEAVSYINSRAKDYLEKDKSGKGCICPICGSGSGSKGTGITSKDGVHFTCWAGCFSHSDIIDIIGLEYNLTDYNSKLEKACSIFNVELDNSNHRSTAQEDFRQPENQNQPKSKQVTQLDIHNSDYTTKDTQLSDYRLFFSEAHNNLHKTDYYRGLSLETLNRFNIGYVENYNAHNKGAIGWNCLIIPTSNNSYVIRNTDTQAEDKNRYRKQGSSHIFNLEAIKTAQKPIVICEGEIDCMSIIDAGGEAVGLGSVSNTKALLTYLEENRPEQPLVIALDNDKAGEKATVELKTGLEALGLTFYVKDICSPNKDANEALLADRESFTAKVKEVENIREAEEQAEKKALESECAFNSVVNFWDYIKENKGSSYVPTGFKELDHLLDGGLYAGLYVVGAISSLGKTTLTLQIADNIAKSGVDVLIFSLEMAKYELIAKSVSRLTYLNDNSPRHQKAKTTRGILTGSRYSSYNEEEKKHITDAIADYADNFSEHIYITEGMGNVSVEHIVNKVQRHKRITGKAPVVLIDYLQIIQPADVRATDKQNTDIAVTALKRLSRDYNIPVLAISSFNRENYTAPVNLTSFKESGAVEYSSDVLLGLQYEGMDYKEEETEKNRDKRIRTLVKEQQEKGKKGSAQTIQVKVLKNRNGSKGACLLHYVPMFNCFSDCFSDVSDFETSEDTEEEDTEELEYISGFKK